MSNQTDTTGQVTVNVGDRVTLKGSIYSGRVTGVFDGAYGRQVRVDYDAGHAGIWMSATDYTTESASA